jgi:hypothetical protein
LYFDFPFEKIKIEESSYGIPSNTFWINFKFVGKFMMLPCIPYCPYLHNWKICANARRGAIKHSSIFFNIKKIHVGLLFTNFSHKLKFKGLPKSNFFQQFLHINT